MSDDSAAALRAVVLGAGYIGTDLLYKIARSNRLRCVLVVGRRSGTVGLRRADSMGLRTSTEGISALMADPDAFDVVFDCTDAVANREHWRMLKQHGKRLINLTPAISGHMIIPAINGDDAAAHSDVNMISCGGQAAIPLLAALASVVPSIDYVEIVTSAASSSVGMGTRVNLDEYIDATSLAVQVFARAGRVKSMVNLSPARPPVVFRVTIFVQAAGIRMGEVEAQLASMAERVRAYCPGYRLKDCSQRADGTLALDVEVEGGADYLPVYAGNLDIINAAAIRVAGAMA